MLQGEEASGATALPCVEAREAAEMLGLSRRAVRNLVARGELEANRDGTGAAARLLIPVAAVEKRRSERCLMPPASIRPSPKTAMDRSSES